MTLHVYTARISCRDPDRFDVTRKSGGAAGHTFAPSLETLGEALKARRLADGLRSAGRAREADDVEEAAWSAYVPKFLHEMRQSYRVNRAAWDGLLARERVVLVCYCATRDRCHRGLLASRILPSLGAVDGDELQERRPASQRLLNLICATAVGDK